MLHLFWKKILKNYIPDYAGQGIRGRDIEPIEIEPLEESFIVKMRAALRRCQSELANE
jgi:hypothetical protein